MPPHKMRFRVVHVSGQDENYKASGIADHQPGSRGWQSAKFCLYPQDIVLYLEVRSRLRKIQILSHQFLIATKIEFFIGDIPDGVPHTMQNARYTRLGYVALSDNEKTHFRARELKSVHVDAIGVYLKLVVHKNYINKYNLYNQVGVVAVNLIGNEVKSPYDYGHHEDVISLDTTENISPLEDLAFDMYQDPEVAAVIRQLEKKKHSAVLDEKFDFAKRLRDAISHLQLVGEKLGKLDVEKRQAIENEDYERAKLKKIQIDEHRLRVFKELDVSGLLNDQDVRPIELNYPPRNYTPARRIETPPPPPPQEPLPSKRSPRVYNDPEDRPLPALKARARPPPPEEEIDNRDEPIGEPEHMSERDMREAAGVIEVFGMGLVAKAYSKTWSHREDALLEVLKKVRELPPETDKEEAKSIFRAAAFLAQKGAKDKVFAVFNAALTLNKYLLVNYSEDHHIPKADLHFAVDKVTPPLLSRTGETAVRIRELAKDYLLEMSLWQQTWNFPSFYNEALKPFGPTTMDRLSLSRTELVASLYEKHGLGHHHFNLESLMNFSSKALQHRAGEVREAAESLIVLLYEHHDRNVIRSYLPPDDQQTRKNPLYKRLFDKFDRLDGKSDQDGGGDTSRTNANKQREIEKLQKELQELREQEAANKKANTPRKAGGSDSKASARRQDETPQTDRKAAAPPPEPHEDEPLINLDNTCIFCGETNKNFTDAGLDVHYWKSCPMLRRCNNCNQVVEIATMTEHLLQECEAKANFKQCPRCTEAIPVTEHEGHVADDCCPPGEDGKERCTLCHQNIDPGEDSWHQHLMSDKDGCPQNPRRLAKQQAQQKGNPGNSTKASANGRATNAAGGGQKKSGLPQPKNRGATK